MSYDIWKINFGWGCNAEGGGLGELCKGEKFVPDQVGTLPPDLIHCKTTVTLKKKDPGDTSAGWKVRRSDQDEVYFWHYIRAQSGLVGAGREIEVAYEHLLIRRADSEALSSRLQCTFTIEERV